MLLRVRVPGGRLTPRQLRTAAEVVGSDGPHLEITARANLQLRGLAGAQVDEAGRRLAA
jgi:precorrin-3B synthase